MKTKAITMKLRIAKAITMEKLRTGKVITMKELRKGNKRLCLSAKRSLGKCYECEQYHERPRINSECESKIVNPEYDMLYKLKLLEQDRHEKRLNDINKRIKELNNKNLFRIDKSNFKF